RRGRRRDAQPGVVFPRCDLHRRQRLSRAVGSDGGPAHRGLSHARPERQDEAASGPRRPSARRPRQPEHVRRARRSELRRLLVAGCVLAFGLTAEAAVSAFFCAVMVAVSAIDLEHRIIPNRIVLPATAVVLIANTLRDPSPQWALAALGASAFLLTAALIYP